MAAKKKARKTLAPNVDIKLPKAGSFLSTFWTVVTLKNIKSILAVAYYIIWIPVGLFLLWFIFANFRVGAFDQLMRAPISQEQAETQAPPTDTDLPGIGKVNIDCVQNNLSQDAIVKIVQEQSDSSLTEDEKTKLQPCVIEPAASVSPSPTE